MTLHDFFAAHPKAALGFSGGVDSAYLLHAALEAGADVRPYFIKTPFQPAFELEDAGKLTEQLGTELTVIELDILDCRSVAENPADRCYHCKKRLFSALKEQAVRDGYGLLLDGTNASDDASDRPGMRALGELEVRSPLRECGLTKPEIRRLSREAGLFTWNKPAYACLATRVPTGEMLTKEILHRIEAGEKALYALGFTNLRLRLFQGAARLQLPGEQIQRAADMTETIRTVLSPWFDTVLLDLKGR